jgi:hypothetical protein
VRQTASASVNTGLCGAMNSASGLPISAAALTPKNCSAAGLAKVIVPARSSAITGLGNAASSAAASGPPAA